MIFGNQPHVLNQAARRAATSRMFAAQAATRRSRIITPPRSAIAEVIEALIEAPPTPEELRLLTGVATTAETDEAEAERLLEGTRLGELLRMLARNDVRLLTYIMTLLMILGYFKLEPSPPPPPAPQVNVTVSAEEIARQVEEDTQRACEDREPTPDEEHLK